MENDDVVCFSGSPWEHFVKSNNDTSVLNKNKIDDDDHDDDGNEPISLKYDAVRESFVHRPVPVSPPLDEFLRPVAGNYARSPASYKRGCSSPACLCHSLMDDCAGPLFQMATARSRVGMKWDPRGSVRGETPGGTVGQKPKKIYAETGLLLRSTMWTLIIPCAVVALVLRGGPFNDALLSVGLSGGRGAKDDSGIVGGNMRGYLVVGVLLCIVFWMRFARVVRFERPGVFAAPTDRGVASLLVTHGLALVTNGKRLLRIAQEHQLFCQGRRAGSRLPPASVLEQSTPRLFNTECNSSEVSSPSQCHSSDVAWAVHAGRLSRAVLSRVWTTEQQLLARTFDHLLSCLPCDEQRNALLQSLDWQMAVFGGPEVARRRNEPPLGPDARLHQLRLLSARVTLLRSHVLTAAMVACGCPKVVISIDEKSHHGLESAAKPVLPPCCQSKLEYLANHWALASAQTRSAIIQTSQVPIQFLVDSMEATGNQNLDSLVDGVQAAMAKSAGKARQLVTEAGRNLEKTVALSNQDCTDTAGALKNARVLLADARFALLAALREVDQNDSELHRLLSKEHAVSQGLDENEPTSICENRPPTLVTDEQTDQQQACEFEFSPPVACGSSGGAIDHDSFDGVTSVGEEKFETVADGDSRGDRTPSKWSQQALQLQKLQQADFEAKLDLLKELQTVLISQHN